MDKRDIALISVITMTYKKFERLYETVGSVLAQDYPNIEYIISDDGSGNFPITELEQFVEKNNKKGFSVKILANEKNVGTVKNANRAYKEAKGDFFFNLSCGDVFFDDSTVGRIVDRFNTEKCLLMATSRLMYRGNYEPLCLLPHYSDREKIEKWDTNLKQYEALVGSSFLDMASGSAMYFTREIIEKLNYFDEKYVLWEDGPFLEKYLWDNTLGMAYDIISIWYEDGGVSNGGVNPLLEKDIALYNMSDRIKHIDEISSKAAARVRYRVSSQQADNRVERLLLKIKQLPVFVHFLKIYVQDKINTRRDRIIIKELLAGGKK